MADEFFDVRNHLTIGNYHQAIADVHSVRPMSQKSDDLAAFDIERQALLARAQIGLEQFDTAVGQLRDATHPTLVAVRRWGQLSSMARRSGGVELSRAASEVLAELNAAAEQVEVGAVQSAICAVAANATVGDFAGALTLAHKWLSGLPAPQGGATVRERIELYALVVECLLRMRRYDHASQAVKAMELLDDEALLTTLCKGLVHLHAGVCDKNRQEQALQAFTEVMMRSSSSVLLQNLVALANMGLHNYEAAESSLLDALVVKSSDPDTIANLSVVSSHVGKGPDVVERYMSQLPSLGGSWILRYQDASTGVDAAVERFVSRQ